MEFGGFGGESVGRFGGRGNDGFRTGEAHDARHGRKSYEVDCGVVWCGVV